MTKKTDNLSWYHPAFLIATWFGAGKIPFAPGTWGSFFTFPLFLTSHYLLFFASSEASFSNLYLLFIFLLFILGNWASNIYMARTGKQDPGEIVIDEVVGQIIVFFAAFVALAPHFGIFETLYGTEDSPKKISNFSEITDLFLSSEITAKYIAAAVPIYFLCFVLFRIFDIFKPWPIKWCDQNMKGGFGVMFDDVFAAVYAVIVLYILGLLLLS